MKKILAIIMTICMIATVLCVPAFAALLTELDAAPVGTVLRLSALKKNGIPVVIKDYDNFEEGWEAAVDLAEDTEIMKTNGYDRVVVDFYADWIANEDGEFGNGGDGFEWSTIHITEDIRITLNLNNHTINRNLKEWEYDGEVIYIDENADVIINDGTISGGWSCNGAGGIHICEKARVVLNNVNIVGNNVDDDDGAGIAVYKGAILTMNGGSFQNNVTDGVDAGAVQGAAAYVEDGTATFNDVSFKNNQSFITYAAGTAIYATGSTVAVNNCTFEENGIKNTEKEFTTPITLISASASSITIKNSSFKGNGCYKLFSAEDSEFIIEGCQITKNLGSELFTMRDSNGDIKDVTITGNTLYDIFYIADSEVDVTNATIRDNVGQTLYIHNDDSEMVTLTNCTLGNNTHPTEGEPDVYIVDDKIVLVFVDSTLGDMTFNDEDLVKVIYSGVAKEDAAISVTKLFKDGTNETVYYRFFEYGWNLAIEAALTHDYERIIVDLYDDWNAVDGQFTDEFSNGAGFDWDAIYIPANVKITLNMNGHTIDRGLTDNEANGEVIYIGSDADVIINGGSDGDPIARGDDANATFGTITGGNSHNGAGGIHINDNAKVVLNNVCIYDNRVEDDDGAGIAVYDGATLIMNGGSISNNETAHSGAFYGESYGGLFVSDANAVLTDVLITDNGTVGLASGAAILMKDSYVTMKNCYVVKNGYQGGPKKYTLSSTIEVNGSSSVLDITDSKFENNGSEGLRGGCLIYVNDGTLKVNNSEFLNNPSVKIISCYDGLVEITNSRFEGNAGYVFIGEGNTGSHFTNCTFSGNSTLEKCVTFKFESGNDLLFNNCDLGDATFNDRSRATFDGAKGVGSIFGEGSLTMIVAILALVASAVSIFLVADTRKKLVFATANKTAETEAEDEE